MDAAPRALYKRALPEEITMRITESQLRRIIRQEVRGLTEARGAAQSVYTPKDLVNLARRNPEQLENIGQDAYGAEPQEASIEFPSGRREKISSVMIDEYGDVQVDFVSLVMDPIRMPLASANRRR